MGYIEDSLAPGERIVYRTKLHPVIFIWPLLFIAISAAAFFTGRENLGQISLALAAALEVYNYFQRRLSDFALTNRRVIGKFFTTDRVGLPEVMLLELCAIEFKPGIFSALFDYGTVLITDFRGKQHKFPGLPAEFYRQVNARLARNERILK